MNKYICIKSYRFLNYGAKIGDIIEFEKSPYDSYYVYKNGEIIDLIVNIYADYFIPLADWREKQIDSILE